MANPFYIEPASPLKALIMGQQGFNQAREAGRGGAREEAAQLYQSGDKQGALARLMQIGDMQGAQTLASLGNNERDFAFRQAESQRAQQNADRSFALQQRQLAVSSGNAAADRAWREAEARRNQENADRAFKFQQENTGNRQLDAQIAQRRQAASNAGLDPNSPAGQSYVLTGKMPREDQQPLTATDKKAILEADEAVLAAETAIDGLRKAKTLSPKAYSGPLAGTRGYATSLVGAEGGETTAELDNLITSNALTQLKSIFGGMPTEGERKILLDVQGSVNQPDAVRQKIYDRAIALANRRLEFNRQRASEMRGGSFYKTERTQPSQSNDPISQARMAISRGADPAAVRQRLIQNGIDPSGL